TPSAPWSLPGKECPLLLWPEPVNGQQVYCEPIAVWLSFIRRANAFLRLVAAVKMHRLGDASDWHTLFNDQPVSAPNSVFRLRPAGAFVWFPTDVPAARNGLMPELGKWFQVSGVQFALSWDEFPRFQLGGGTFATLCVQLLQETAWGAPALICTICGEPYL